MIDVAKRINGDSPFMSTVEPVAALRAFAGRGLSPFIRGKPSA